MRAMGPKPRCVPASGTDVGTYSEEGPRQRDSSSGRSSWLLDLPGSRVLKLGPRPLVMGVLNITPDSFSDGGCFLDPELALDHALAMVDGGADLLDLGAESTRPGGGVYGEGAEEVSTESELARLLPVLERLRAATSVPLSVDTRKVRVAEAALEAGGDVINDVSALGDPGMATLVADRDVPLILMHSRGHLRRMQVDIRFSDVVGEVVTELETLVERASQQGVRRSQIVLDPGIGFGKTRRQNLELLGQLNTLHSLERPILVGASRKSFIGEVGAAAVGDRLPGSLAAAAWARLRGAQILRVHDVPETVQFLRVWDAIEEEAGTLWA